LLLSACWALLFPAVYGFAGGDEEWDESGNVAADPGGVVCWKSPCAIRSRGWGRPPTAPYANREADWLLNSRAIVDRTTGQAHTTTMSISLHMAAMVGLALFFWFAGAYGLLGLRVYKRYSQGFAGGYAAGMLAAGAASLVIMVLADWMLPFVYNIGFHGFQASVLVWLFWGGLVAIDQMDRRAGDGV
jgi:hypothetical protein